MDKFAVFLSYKNTNPDDKESLEATMVKELYDALTQKGISVFYCKQSLEQLGVAQYKKAIDAALDESVVLVAVGTSAENLNSNWVRYEWDGFYSDILSGQKQGQVYSYIDNMVPSSLPRT